VHNYFNYFTEIEERFQQRRGSLLLLSSIDWALIETWREAGIPLDAALRGIDAAFDKYDARPKRGKTQRVNGLAWCAQAVMQAATELNAHLEAAAAALDSATVAPEACAATATRLRELAAAVRAAANAPAMDMEWLERTLTVLEEKLFASLTADAPEDLLVDLKTQSARELAPYRSKMGVVQLRQVEQQFVHKRLLDHYRLPRLSLFYMSQQ
jgi:hypothetical protein